jgi:broad-specificity NMP kinase
MKKIIAIGGAPGTGKSTLMKSVMKTYGNDWTFHDEVKLVPYYNITKTYVLGKYPENEVFGGTDKMSMACQPEVVKFVDSLPDDSVILFEGDRLFNNSFLDYCSKFDLKIVVLKATKEEKQRRYALRKSNQNEVWLCGRESKVNNICSNMLLMPKVTTLPHQNPNDTFLATRKIMELIND